MKDRKHRHPEKRPAGFTLKAWHVAAGVAAALLAVFAAYDPALKGPFVFDDAYLPFYSHDFGEKPLAAAIRGVRPLLMLSFWINHKISGLEPYGYHVLNVLFHLMNGLLVFLITRKILDRAGRGGARTEWLSAFAGGLFLLHPVQTESVAYVASRSENLSVLFFYSAFALFLYRRAEAVSWRTALGVVALFGAAATTKEHTVILPALLLLTDYWWNPGFSLGGIRRNWRLYVPLGAAGAAGVAVVWSLLKTASTAGFGVEGLPWHHYFFTQCRALWVYFKLFVFPAGQNADYDFAISRTLLDHGAVIGLAGLLAAAGCAWYFRRRWPLASYGFLAALLLFAPTSSFVPIQDAVAERRMYLPMIGLIFVVLEIMRRLKASRTAMAGAGAAVLLVAGVLTHARSAVWSSETVLWEDTAKKSPQNARAHSHLAMAYYSAGRCEEAVERYEIAGRLKTPDYRLLLNWAIAEDCLNRPDGALAKLFQAARHNDSAHVNSLIGMVYAKQKKFDEALAALNRAVEIDPNFDMTYVYRGNVYVLLNNAGGALDDYRRAIELNPNNQSARNSLARLKSRLGGGR